MTPNDTIRRDPATATLSMSLQTAIAHRIGHRLLEMYNDGYTGVLSRSLDEARITPVRDALQTNGTLYGWAGARSYYGILLSLYNDVPVFTTKGGTEGHTVLVTNPLSRYEAFRSFTQQLSTALTMLRLDLRVASKGRDITQEVLRGASLDVRPPAYMVLTIIQPDGEDHVAVGAMRRILPPLVKQTFPYAGLKCPKILRVTL